MNLRFVRLLIASFSLAISPLAVTASEQPEPGGTLTMGIRSDLLLTNPFVNMRSTQGRILDLIYDPFLGIDLNGRIQPSLAASWDVSSDGTVYTFKLRNGVRFHNGEEMTAQDVKFSIDYARNPKNGAHGFRDVRVIDRVETAGRYTVRVFLKTPSPGFLAPLTALRAFPVVPRDSVPEGLEKVSTFPPGTGPFKFAEWTPLQRVVLERFGDYWGHKSFIERAVLRPIRDDTIRLAALRTGDVDIIERAPLEWIKQIADGKLKGIRYTPAHHVELRGIEFNAADPPFNNKKLRQAVAYAINKKELLDAAFMGLAETTDQVYHREHDWYFKGLSSYSYDPRKARSLLGEARYRGEVLEFLVHSSATDQAKATALQAQLKRIGMNVKLTLVDTGEYRARPRKGEFAIKFAGGTPQPDPLMSYGDFRCEPDLKKRANNTSGYCDKEMDALIAKAEKETHPESRRALFREIVAKLLDEVPVIYVGLAPQFFAQREVVKGFTTDSNANFRWLGGGLNHAWLDP